MKKILFAFLAVVLLSLPSFALDTWRLTATLTGGVVSDNTDVTVTLPPRVGSISYLYVPTITASTLAVSGSVDGTNFGTIYDPISNGTTKIAWGVASSTGGIIVQLPDISAFRYLKIVCGTAQPSNRAFVVFGR